MKRLATLSVLLLIGLIANAQTKGNMARPMPSESLNRVLQVQPNPAASFTSVTIADPSVTISRVEFYDEAGELVLVKTADADFSKIDLTELDRGLFFVKVIDRSGRVGTRRVFHK